MSCRILASRDGEAVFYCSTTMTAFGPVMGGEAEAEAFLKYLGNTNPRTLADNQLRNQYSDFVRAFVCECGAVKDENCETGPAPARVGRFRCSNCISLRPRQNT